ncbi:MAG: hypothetical protein J2P37_18195 [Ktedonobacteraceae bacterium]|nr:hypothetical protein [Ktedonobacteraceae bacterium]MBO0791212.1 hypothetical protein [Ktedonobacteraceae bacterium]
MRKEYFQREDGFAEERRIASVSETKSDEAQNQPPPTQSEAPASKWAAWPVSRRAFVAGMIAGGIIGLGADGIGLFAYLRSHQSPVTPIKPPQSLIYTYRGHVHALPKPFVVSDSFAFLGWLPQSRRIVSLLNGEVVTPTQIVSSCHTWDAFDGGHASIFRFPVTLSRQSIVLVNPSPLEGGPRVTWSDFNFSSKPKGMIHVTDIATGKDLFAYPIHDPAEETSPFVCSPDGRLAASAIRPFNDSDLADGIQVSNLSTRKGIAALVERNLRFREDVLSPRGWRWSPDSQRLISWYEDTADLYVWRAEAGQLQTRYQKHRMNDDDDYAFFGPFATVLWSPNSRLIASLDNGAAPGPGKKWNLQVWQADNGSQIFITEQKEGMSIVESVQWSPDSQMLAILVREILGADATDSKNSKWSVQIWSAASGRQLFTIGDQKQEYIQSVQWSPDSQMLAVAIADVHQPTPSALDKSFAMRIEVWRAAGGTLLATKPQRYPVLMAWSPESKQIISNRLKVVIDGSAGEELELWEAATGRQIATYSDPTTKDFYATIAWSPDGQYVAVGAESGAVQVWKVR